MGKISAKSFEFLDIKNMLCSGILSLLWFALSFVNPHRSFISPGDPTYSYPNNNNETVPTGWLIGVIFPFSWAFICIIYFAAKKFQDRIKSPKLFTAIWCNVIIVSFTSIIVFATKNYVGRYAPNFFKKCGSEYSTPDNCTAINEDDLNDLMRAFPSNHSATCFASVWFLIKLAVYSLTVKDPIICMILYLMLFVPLWVGCSRIRDYRRHPSDVTAGFFIGYLISELFWKPYKRKIFEDPNNSLFDGSSLVQE